MGPSDSRQSATTVPTQVVALLRSPRKSQAGGVMACGWHSVFAVTVRHSYSKVLSTQAPCMLDRVAAVAASLPVRAGAPSVWQEWPSCAHPHCSKAVQSLGGAGKFDWLQVSST